MVTTFEPGSFLDQVRDYVMTFLGIIMALTPPALWFGWRQDLFWIVISASVGSAVLYYILAHFEPPPPKRWGGPRQIKKVELSDEFLAVLTDSAPWTYHHGVRGNRSFRGKMERLRQLMK